MTIYAPSVFQDRLTGDYYASAQFVWNNGSTFWKADFPDPWPEEPGFGVNIGGLDGFGLYFSRPIDRISSSFSTLDMSGNRHDIKYPQSYTSSGIAYVGQDVGFKSGDGSFEYTWHRGIISIYFEPQDDPVGTFSVTPSLTHTWGGTSVRVTGISQWGISWEYVDGSDGWDAVGDTTIYRPL